MPSDMKKATAAATKKRHSGAPRAAPRGNQTALRVAQVRALKARGLPDGRVIDICTAQWGVGRRAVSTYLMAVREETRKLFQESVDSGALVAEVVNRMDFVYQDAVKHKRHMAAIRATQVMVDLAGVAAPRRVELTGAEGAPIEVQKTVNLVGLSDEQFAALGGILGEKDTEE